MEAGRKQGASHFVLLSAICVQKPLLEFQRAKLAFEEKLQVGAWGVGGGGGQQAARRTPGACQAC